MVPNLVGNAGGVPPATSNRELTVSVLKLRGHNSVKLTSVGRLQGLRQFWSKLLTLSSNHGQTKPITITILRGNHGVSIVS